MTAADEMAGQPTVGQIWEWRGTERPRLRFRIEAAEPDAVTLIPLDPGSRTFVRVGRRTLAAEYQLATDAQPDESGMRCTVCGKTNLHSAHVAPDPDVDAVGIDLEAIRAHLATLLGGWWHADVDNQATSDALHAVIGDVPALVAEIERLTALNDEVTRVKWHELGELKTTLAEAEDRGHRAGREAAAQDLRDRSDAIDVEANRVGPRATLRRHLGMAARIAAGAPTPAEAATALDAAVKAGQVIVCRTRDIEPDGRRT